MTTEQTIDYLIDEQLLYDWTVEELLESNEFAEALSNLSNKNKAVVIDYFLELL